MTGSQEDCLKRIVEIRRIQYERLVKLFSHGAASAEAVEEAEISWLHAQLDLPVSTQP